MVTTLCTSGAVVLKAGINSRLLTEAQFDQLINQAEGFVSTVAREDYVTNYASVSTIGKTVLEDATSSKAAMAVINNDMSGFSSRTEAQVMLDVNYSNVVDIMDKFQDDKYRAFIMSGVVA